MLLNTLKPTAGSRKPSTRRGRGMGSGLGKTSGRGHKGQKSRSGGLPKIGFEGGQMPLQRRLPKVGFSSRLARVTAEIRLSELNSLKADIVDINTLKDANLIGKHIKYIKVMVSGKIETAITLKGIRVTKGAREAIEAAGGKIEE